MPSTYPPFRHGKIKFPCVHFCGSANDELNTEVEWRWVDFGESYTDATIYQFARNRTHSSLKKGTHKKYKFWLDSSLGSQIIKYKDSILFFQPLLYFVQILEFIINHIITYITNILKEAKSTKNIRDIKKTRTCIISNAEIISGILQVGRCYIEIRSFYLSSQLTCHVGITSMIEPMCYSFKLGFWYEVTYSNAFVRKPKI